MLILDKKMKQAIKKHGIWSNSCSYIYPDGIVFTYNHKHTYKGKEFTDRITLKQKVNVPIYKRKSGDSEFKGRIVLHKSSLLLDGIRAEISCWFDGSIAMREKGIRYQAIAFVTNGGLEIHEVELPGLMAGYFTIQEGGRWNMDIDFPDE
jgi:hypothetical protein